MHVATHSTTVEAGIIFQALCKCLMPKNECILSNRWVHKHLHSQTTPLPISSLHNSSFAKSTVITAPNLCVEQGITMS
jgi:hypothetical protein